MQDARSLADTIARSDNNFNVIRLIAASAVIFGHSFSLSLSGQDFTGPTTRLLPFFERSGNLGVYAFFLISGILVTQSWCRGESALKFATQRVARIYPALLLCLVFTAYVIGPLGTASPLRAYFGSKPVHDYILNNLALTNPQWSIPTVFVGTHYLQAMNGSLWSLVVEARMYIVVFAFGVIGLLS